MKQKKSKRSLSNDLYLSIVECIKSTGKLPKNLMSKSLMSFYVCRLKKEGIIKRVGYGVWEVVKQRSLSFRVTPYHPKYTPNFSSGNIGVSDWVRLHNVVFKIRLDRFINWSFYLNKINLSFFVTNKGIFSFSFNGFKVWLCSDKVLIYVKPELNFTAVSVEESLKLCLAWFYPFVRDLEGFLGVSLRSSAGLVWSLDRKHFSLVKNALAHDFNSRGEKLRVYDARGCWLVVDDSFNLDELEFIRSKTNVGETKVIQDWFNDYKLNPMKVSEIKEIFVSIATSFTAQAVINKQFQEFMKRFGGFDA